MARHTFTSGLSFTSSEQLMGERLDYSYFWLNKRYDKLSFILGPRDNQSSNSTAWLVIYGDNKKILYEEVVTQSDLPRQVVVDVSGQEQICFSNELRSNDFLGSITFAAVDMFVYPKGDTSVPKAGLANINKDKVAGLPSPCALMSNILPYSVRGVAAAKNTMFTGESSYITFSMGGVKYMEGIILAPGTNLMDDKIDAYATFDLAEEFDYVSFYAGALTNRRVLDDGRLLVYADDRLILDTVIYCTRPNDYFELPLHKCRMLKFVKPSTSSNKQIFIGLGDIALYRGRPAENDLFYHEYPDFPEEADLIDLCGRPYFHFVGRYLSTLTNFDFNDCFYPGGTQRQFFQMKDGSKIYKGVMLEANVPLPFEDIRLTDAITMFLVGAGSALSHSDVSAYTGVTAGGGLAGDMAVLQLMNPKNNGQASVVAFNPYGQYETCTFSIANKSEYWDDMSKVTHFGQQVQDTFKLYVIADRQLVKELDVYNTMEPQTITVPIHQCRQLMFWLAPGDYRSGQFVLYDMKVSKKPLPAIEPEVKSQEPKQSVQPETPATVSSLLDLVENPQSVSVE
ncbi:MAG: NPCBM/NEW2 domain-containing protein [Paludibacteraceae bacterium]|nr:NPCBM/NEW2 domain-containing protein [Paludibacteraceae bacterium]